MKLDSGRIVTRITVSWHQVVHKHWKLASISLTLCSRSHLMQIIQQRMIQGVLPRGLNRSTSCTLPPNRSAYQVLMETFRACFKKGCVDLKAIHMFEHLINVGGAKWFCEHIIRVSKKILESLDLLMGYIKIITNMDDMASIYNVQLSTHHLVHLGVLVRYQVIFSHILQGCFTGTGAIIW